MLINLLQTDPMLYAVVVLTIIFSICLHELAHGYAAVKLGDDTPIVLGHMNMNPLVHMGPFSILMVAILGIGWGAMPVNPSRLRGRHGDAIVSVAGPLVNLSLAFIVLTGFGLWLASGAFDHDDPMHDGALTIVEFVCGLNIVLFLLNMIPIPPLDGSRVLASYSPAYARLLSDPAMQGAAMAGLIAVFFVGGRFLFPMAQTIMVNYLSLFA